MEGTGYGVPFHGRAIVAFALYGEFSRFCLLRAKFILHEAAVS